MSCLPRAFPQRPLTSLLLFLLLAGSSTNASWAQGPAPSVIEGSFALTGVTRSAIGVTRQGRAIDLFLQQEDVDLRTEKTRLVLLGGLAGDRPSVDAVLTLLRWFHDPAATHSFREHYTLSAVPCANPDDLVASKGDSRRNLSRGYPPTGKAYHNDQEADESAYLWRWLGVHAPDLVIDLRVASETGWLVPPTLEAEFVKQLPAMGTATTSGDLLVELGRHDVCQVGPVPALRLEAPAAELPAQFGTLLTRLQSSAPSSGPSPARQVLQGRLSRTPLVVARQLAEHYGHDLNQVVYIPAVALIGQVRLSQLAGQPTSAMVERVVQPYVIGDAPTRPTSGSGLSGHLIFTELAAASTGAKRDRYLEIAQRAADLAFDDAGQIKPIMPFHHEMSDAAFMGGPILAAVGRLTGDDRYFQACATHLESVRALVLRQDGLYRHSPLDEAAWGRGNGFPALGLAMCLTDFPADHPSRPELLDQFRRHLRTLAKHQDPTGCWHQVVDRPESYRELSSTCMITYAMARGVRQGWLERSEFQPVIDRAWLAINARVAADGQLVDVCTGTGKQKTLRDYYDRTAILGRDPRGGAMALLVATELAAKR